MHWNARNAVPGGEGQREGWDGGEERKLAKSRKKGKKNRQGGNGIREGKRNAEVEKYRVLAKKTFYGKLTKNRGEAPAYGRFGGLWTSKFIYPLGKKRIGTTSLRIYIKRKERGKRFIRRGKKAGVGESLGYGESRDSGSPTARLGGGGGSSGPTGGLTTSSLDSWRTGNSFQLCPPRKCGLLAGFCSFQRSWKGMFFRRSTPLSKGRPSLVKCPPFLFSFL